MVKVKVSADTMEELQAVAAGIKAAPLRIRRVKGNREPDQNGRHRLYINAELLYNDTDSETE